MQEIENKKIELAITILEENINKQKFGSIPRLISSAKV